MIRLAYISKQTVPLSTDEIKRILQQSIRNNASKSITGMLLFYNGTFLQILEGNEKSIKDLYEALELDSRHKDLAVVYKKEIDDPSFTSWSMGFVDVEEILNKGDKDFVHLFNEAFNKNAENTEIVKDKINTIMEKFQHGAWRTFIH